MFRRKSKRKELALNYLMSFVGIHYKWAGNNPIEGFDCSGLVLEFLNAFFGRIKDTTAHDLYDIFKREIVSDPEFGTLIFFGTKEKITHVAIALDDKLMIEAGGGDSTVINHVVAAKKNAFVRIRPINRRADRVAMCNPNYKWD